MKKQTLMLPDIITPELALIYLRDPVRFVREVIFNVNWKGFGGKLELTSQQVKMLRAITTGKRNVSVRAGRGVGKSAFLAWLVLWWICLMGDTQIVLTAPSFPQLKSVLWKGVGDWLKRSIVRNCFEYTSEKLYRKDNVMVWAEPRTASKIESANGLHNDTLLIIADEATGIDEAILEAFAGSLTGEMNRMFLMFNPTKATGFAYDSHNRVEHLWTTFAFSSLDSEIVDKQWLDDSTEKHCPGGIPDDWYKANVLGEFVEGNPDALFDITELYAARDRHRCPNEGVVEIGIDLAEKGADLTVVAPRWGNRVLSALDIGFGTTDTLCAWGRTEAPQTNKNILRIIELVRLYTGTKERMTIKLDNGGLGSPIISYLSENEADYNIKIVRVNFGGEGAEEDNNTATMMWFNVKDKIGKIKIPYDEQLIEEMASRKWYLADNGKRCLESKKVFKARFKNKSPDKADAVMLAFANVDNERNVVSSYTDTTKRVVIPSERIARLGNRFCGCSLNGSGMLSVVSVAFNNGMLGVYNCIEASVDMAIGSGIFNDQYKWTVGSDNMFNGGADISLKMLMSGIAVIAPFMYDESGAVLGLDILTKREGFVVGDTCDLFRDQLATWTVNRSRTDLIENHGLCYATLQIVSMLMLQYREEFVISVDRREMRRGRH